MKRQISVVLVALLFPLTSGCGRGLIGDLAGSAITGMTVKDALKHFEGIVNHTLATASTEGDAKLARAANELEMATKTLSAVFDEKYDKAIRDLSEHEQKLFVHLVELEKQIGQGLRDIKRTQELVNLDLIEFTNRIPLLDKVPFYVSSINGIAVSQAEAQHELEVVGIGFGYGDGHTAQNTDLLIDGKSLPPSAFRRKSAKELVITIPRSILEGHYKERELSFIPAKFQVTTKSNRIFGSDGHFSVDMLLIALPKFAGSVNIEESVIVMSPGPQHTYDLVKNVAKSSPQLPNDWSQPWTCPPDCVIDSVEYLCEGGGCNWSYNPKGGYSVNYSLSNDKRSVVVKRHCDGPACTVTHRITYTEFVKTPKLLAGKSQNIEFGTILEVELDKRNEKHEFRIQGKTYLGQPIYVDNNSISQPMGPLKCISSGPYNGEWKARFSVEE
jgi:hypothetical protein